jgi:hypothetical protein
MNPVATKSILAAGLLLMLGTIVAAQTQARKLSPEMERLKQMEGTWAATIKFGEAESKGTMVYKMDLGDQWLTSEFKADFGGAPFHGKGMDTYDSLTKKYVSVWVDSMATVPLNMQGDFDKEGKLLTMTGDSRGPDGKMAKTKIVTNMTDNDTMDFTMYGPGSDGKEGPMMTIHYSRKK